ncbi:2-hydroxy-3-oxopropionate reductase [Sediminispirochaeta smaragdinae]|uniref:2-hydroxy-3-oxopropionate reductase n=1 Tax=Sediminispirochaeta smaragdinae (strain DSM 11293 / JCM 15392 / SEBR 4228) TaxID=573413 RepID=E1RBC5_SEDSS|nr:2-hydroxy-3-oxopropionate reductase [Sediminispirochaeta smaragdinae]ADK79655.1 2-hydroxy-3-oxopropionate reductase [Sediminispirochaeta smaragdinae DSM 11293]
MKIGFIGLGIMGKPMVRNLLKAGYEVTVYDIVAVNMDDAVQAGAYRGTSPANIAAGSDLVITMLPNSPHVKSVVLGENGVLTGAKSGLKYVDMSSIAPLASKEIGKACAEKGVRMLDAPVSGGEPKAVDGTLSIMAGGEQALFDEVKPVLECMGASVVLCGDIGAGNTTKLANQMIVAGNIAILAEALTLAKKAGVNPQTVFEAIQGGLAGSTVMQAKAPMMIASDFKPGFKIDLHIKDLNNAIATGHDIGSPLFLTTSVQEMFEMLHADGCGQDDHSGLAKYYAKISGTTIGA